MAGKPVGPDGMPQCTHGYAVRSQCYDCMLDGPVEPPKKARLAREPYSKGMTYAKFPGWCGEHEDCPILVNDRIFLAVYADGEEKWVCERAIYEILRISDDTAQRATEASDAIEGLEDFDG